MTTIDNTETSVQRADWADDLWRIHGDSYKHSRKIVFEVYPEPNGSGWGSNGVMIEQYQGDGVLPPDQYDACNRWRNGLPLASIHLGQADADTCRSAAAALLEAAALLDRIGDRRADERP